MPVGVEAWLIQVPPVTRAWLLLSVATTLAVVAWIRAPGFFRADQRRSNVKS